MLATRLSEHALLADGMIHPGRERGVAQGPLLVDPSADPNKPSDRALLGHARILGGGVSYIERKLGLVIRPDHQDAIVNARLALAVNKRFFNYQKGIQIGVAKAHTDKYVELAVHPRYKDNLERYMQVVRAIPFVETPSERASRMVKLEEQLLDPQDPNKVARAAVELEAIGSPAADTLLKGLKSPDLAVQFYAAEALAYLGHREAAEPLGLAARTEPAFRLCA